ncbi:MAG: hypothetical protein COB15_11875 [Flavobacteriales bacterium]|nr:MAG: hypothetical protein COB15_11875 [Flavobacteriales bacterium]
MKKNHSKSLAMILLLFCTNSFAQITPTTVQKWAATYSNQDSTDNIPTAIDLNGNLYITGYSYSSSTGQDIVTVKIDPNGTVIWSQTYNGLGNSHDRATGILADASGNVYVAGTSVGTSTTNDFVLLKYDINGNQQFVNYYDNGSNENAVGVGFDAAGNIYVGGTSAGTSTNNDFAVVKYNSTGNQQWVYRYDHNSGNDYAISFRTGLNGTSYITGNSYDVTTQSDIATIAIDNNGNQVWANRYNNSFNGNEQVEDLEIDALGNVYLCGNTQINNSDYDYIAIKYSPTGTPLWTSIYNGSQQNDLATSIGFDQNSNDVFVTGREWLSNGDYELTSICFDAVGNQKWVQKHYEKLIGDYKAKLFPNGNGGVYVSATTEDQNLQNISTLCYDNSGAEIWQKLYNSGNNENVTDLAADPLGNVYVVGQTYDGLNYQFLAIKYGKKNTLIPPDYYNEPVSNTLNFYQNKGQVVDLNGQTAKNVLFHTNNFIPATYLLKDRVSLVKCTIDSISTNQDSIHRVDMVFNNSDSPELPIPHSVSNDRLSFYMPHIKGGRENINGYDRIHYPKIYSNIDLFVSSNKSGYKYNFVIGVKESPGNLQLTFNGANSLTTGPNGELIIGTDLGNIVFKSPNIYQVNPSNPTGVVPLNWQTSYQITGNIITFPVQNYNQNYPLVIQMDMGENPEGGLKAIGNMDWSTYFNGLSADFSLGITNDNVGNTYMVGKTQGNNFPVNAGSFTFGGNYDAFIARFNINAEKDWCIYYGGTDNDELNSVAYNPVNGDLYALGSASSTNLLIKPLANPNNGSYYQNTGHGSTAFPHDNFDAFILRLTNLSLSSPDLSWASYFGGNDDDKGVAIKVDGLGNVYITGNTKTVVGGSNNCLALTNGSFPLCDPAGNSDYHQNFNAGGYDIYLAKFSQDNNLIASTFMGSSAFDLVMDMDVWTDGTGTDGKVFIVGGTNQLHNAYNQCTVPLNGFFPLCDGVSGSYFSPGFSNNDGGAFISKFDFGFKMQWSTLFDYVDNFQAVHTKDVDGDCYVFAAGNTNTTLPGNTSTNQPIVNELPIATPSGAYQQVNNAAAGYQDVFITHFNHNNVLRWSTFFGSATSEQSSIASTMGFSEHGLSRNFIDLEVDDNNILYLLGVTTYSAFDNFNTTPYSGFYNQSTHAGSPLSTSSFIAAFSDGLNNFWTSLFGGDDPVSGGFLNYSEVGSSISVYNAESLYIAGSSFNTDFPTDCPGITGQEWCDFPLTSTQLAGGSGTISRFDVTNAIGIEENKINGESGLLIYPNPANASVTIITADAITEVKLYNALGQVVLSNTSMNNSKKVILNIEAYPMGIYTVQVKTRENQLLHQKLIIQ